MRASLIRELKLCELVFRTEVSFIRSTKLSSLQITIHLVKFVFPPKF